MLQQLASGTFWIGVGRYSQYAFQLGVAALLARLVEPAEFGVVGMVLVYTGFMTVLSDAGVGGAVVQLRDLDDDAMATAFWMSGGLGAVMALAGVASAGWVEAFFRQPGVGEVMRWMSLCALFMGVAVVPYSRLRREMRFRAVAASDLLGTVGGGILGVGLAFGGAGVWALVAQAVGLGAIRAAAVFLLDRWWPSLRWSTKDAWRILSYGGPVLAFSSINFWARTGDNLMVGRYLGATALGYYSQAYRLMVLPITLTTAVMNPVLHPVLAALHKDVGAMREVYLRAIEFLAVASTLCAVILAGAADLIVLVLYGPGWEEAVPVLQVLAVTTIFQPLISTSGSVFMSRNQTRLLLVIGTINSVAMLGAMAAGLPFGIVGVASGFLLSYLLLVTPLTAFFMARSLGIDAVTGLRVFLRPATFGLLGGIALFAVRVVVPPWEAWVELGLVGGVVLAVTVPLLVWTYRDTLRELRAARRGESA